MGKKPFRRMFSLLLMFLLIADLSSAAFASTPEAEPANVRLQAIDVGNTAPAIRWRLHGANSWHYAESMPLYNTHDAVLYLDKHDSGTAMVPVTADVYSVNRGTLTQFKGEAHADTYPALADLSGVSLKGDVSKSIDEKVLTYTSAKLQANSAIVGLPKATLYLRSGTEGEVTVLLEEVSVSNGASTVIAKGTSPVSAAGDQAVQVVLKRAYDDGEGEQPEFVAYRASVNSALRVSVFTNPGTEITLYSGGNNASFVGIPVMENDENGYNGKITIGGNTYNATMYWLVDRIYVNYSVNGQNDTWISIPSDTPYTVLPDHSADFGVFTFIQYGGSAIVNAQEQRFTGNGFNVQPFPAYRHAVVDTVPIQPVPDLLYLPTKKTLKYDVFMPTGDNYGKTNVPLVIYIHGFGGSYSNISSPFLQDLLKDGYAVAGVPLRNYPSNFSPDYYHDIKGNIRHLRANALKYGIDPNRFGVYGQSLGGNTALMMLVSGDDEYMEGTVGGNLHVSSRVQAGIAGYGWSDMIYFGADQRMDDPDRMASYYSGGDGENAPIAQAIDFYGPGKGLLVVRNYIEARDAAIADGKEEEFYSSNYTFTIDGNYKAKWFPLVRPELAPVTEGIYSYTHAEMEAVIERAKAASPLYYITPDDPPVGMFAGLGGGQQITNNQSTRTLERLNDFGVEGFMWGNTLGNYGNEPEVRAAMMNYLDEYLKRGPSGVRIALTVGSDKAVVNYVSEPLEHGLLYQGGAFRIPLAYVAQKLGADLSGVTTETDGVTSIGGVLYATPAAIRALTNATVNEYQWQDFRGVDRKAVVIHKAAPAEAAPASPVLDPTGISSTYTSYSGFSVPVTDQVYANRVYVPVPAVYEGIRSSFKGTYFEQIYTDPYDPDIPADTFDTINLAVGYILPSNDSGVQAGTLRTQTTGGSYIKGKYPVIVTVSRRELLNGNPFDWTVGQLAAAHGYAYVVIETRGAGSSEGIYDSFASREFRRDVAYIMENWLAHQEWSNGQYVMVGRSNRGLIQTATATMRPGGLIGLAPGVANPDYYYQNYPNGVPSLPANPKYNRTGLNGDTFIGTVDIPGLIAQGYTYENFIAGNAPFSAKYAGMMPVSESEKDLRTLYNAYLTQRYNRDFMTWLHPLDVLRDQALPYLDGEPSNFWTPAGGTPEEGLESITAGNYRFFNIAGIFDPGSGAQAASRNLWGGSIALLNGNHGADIKPEVYLRWFDSVLKGVDNGEDQAPPVYYEVVNKTIDPVTGAGTSATPTLNARYAESFPLANTQDSVLYLAPETEKIEVADALKLHGPQSNNGKLTPVKPANVDETSYRVDMDVGLTSPPDAEVRQYMGDSNLGFNIPREMSQYVDARSLTFTSAPLATDVEIVGIPTIDLWISADQNDVDIIAFLEYVTPGGESYYISRAVQRASHRKTGPNALWDSTPGLAGRYHTSVTADVYEALREDLADPVLLRFNFALVSHSLPAGSSIRVTIAGAYEGIYQHTMYYQDFEHAGDRNYLKDPLPTIKVYTGGDKASFISLPVVDSVRNVINGQVTMHDGSYTGPGTMYLFEENWYLYATGIGKWKKLPLDSDLAEYTVVNNAAVFGNAGFSFLPEGGFLANGVVQEYRGGGRNMVPFPTHYRLKVDTVDIQPLPDRLYLPTRKDLYADIFMPEGTTKDSSVPTIVFIHGFGGTTLGIDSFLVDRIAEGYAVAGVDLRNYPPNFSPDYYHDVKGGIRFLRKHAKEFGLDPDRFGVYGASLGGNTALMAALTGGSSPADQYMEGTVGGNTDVSSRVQAGVIGYGWSDMINFGADQRADNKNNPGLLARMIAGGDGETAPIAMAIDFYGPGKGLLVLRNYLEAREAAKAADKLDEFLSVPYTFTIDDAYIEKYFPFDQIGGFSSGSVVTKGNYTYDHDFLMRKVEAAEKASPLYYVSPDDPVIFLYGGFGGAQNITNNQSVRTFRALNSSGVKAFFAGNTNGNYGREESVQKAMEVYLHNYLMSAGNTVNYTITATAGPGGSISPAGTVYVKENDSRTYVFTPKPGFKISSVIVDGEHMGAITSYTFRNVNSNHTISVTFEGVFHTITATAGSGGMISPSGAVKVAHGDSQTFEIRPNSGYAIDSVVVDGVDVGAVSTYTFEHVTSDHTIAARFRAISGPGQWTAPPSGPDAESIVTDVRDGVAHLIVSDSALNSIIESGKENGFVRLDLSELDGVTAASVPAAVFQALAASAGDGSGQIQTLELVFKDVSVALDSAAIKAIASEDPEADVLILAAEADRSALNSAQADLAGDRPVYEIGIFLGDRELASFGEGALTVTIPYTLRPGEDPDHLVVWHLGEDGSLEAIHATYVDEQVRFTVNHLSKFAVVHFPFEDVAPDKWYYVHAAYAFMNGIMNGMGGGRFDPEGTATRAMIVTMLWRLEGEPQAAEGGFSDVSFSDVKPGQWYSAAISWAAEKGIVQGYGEGRFGPADMVTREQLAVILRNYARFKGHDVSAASGLSAFADAGAISPWALEAMQWANAQGIITGMSTSRLAPGEHAQRAQAAAMLHRWIQSTRTNP